uniref:Secreted protein n=1 Tax=Elaeophora elaphi TaxID=1147741 RepID=A0A0R3S6E3_9BILA
MQVHFLLIKMAILITNLLAFTELGLDARTNACSKEQNGKGACQCCKMACWYDIANAATNNLGHIPGENGEQEALDTLQLIRLCTLLKCRNVCPKIPRSFLKLTN